MSKRGRKPIDPINRKSETIRALVTPAIAEKIKEAADGSGMSESDVIRLALMELLFPLFYSIINDPTFTDVRETFVQRNQSVMN